MSGFQVRMNTNGPNQHHTVVITPEHKDLIAEWNDFHEAVGYCRNAMRIMHDSENMPQFYYNGKLLRNPDHALRE